MFVIFVPSVQKTYESEDTCPERDVILAVKSACEWDAPSGPTKCK
jgi:hypothetical protein